ncbi:hypothetical protein RMATCC62417_16780 [Rhizopus microsporus]|nr:hypothetical protein RMATCC62417_16780 [Rhizopus microsporus]
MFNQEVSKFISEPCVSIEVEFEETFAVGNKFSSMNELRDKAKAFGEKNNIVLSTLRSDRRIITVTYKHGSRYRSAKKAVIVIQQAESFEKPKGTRNTNTQRCGCPCMVYAILEDNQFVIRKVVSQHNHRIMQDPRVYALNRRLDAVQLERVCVLKLTGNFPAKVYQMLANEGVPIIKMDIYNIYTQFVKQASDSLEMLCFINGLEMKGYLVRYSINSSNTVTKVFFASMDGIKQAQKMSECIVLDAIYKMTSHDTVLLNIAGADCVNGQVKTTLANFHIAGVWMDHEKESDYE